MNRRSSHGIVLVTVLWLIMLLMVMAMVAGRVTVVEDRIARAAESSAQAEATADGAIRIVLSEAAAPRPEGRAWDGPEATGSISLFGSSVTVTISHESGRIDVNAADPSLLYAYFRSQGMADAEARTWRDRIADWVDPDDQVRESGAEQSDYRRAGIDGAPANAPFTSVAEVFRVLSESPLDPRVLDGLTVFTHSAGVSWPDARPAVRRALQWADQQQLDGRRWTPDPTAPDNGNNAPPRRPLVGEVLRVRACISETMPLCRVAIVRLTGGNDVPLEVYEWSTEFASGSTGIESNTSG